MINDKVIRETERYFIDKDTVDMVEKAKEDDNAWELTLLKVLSMIED